MGTSNGGSALQDGRFLVLETLGRGGMGTVFRAFDRIDERIVALKVVGEEGRAGPSHPLTTEFEHWTELRHPNIVQAHGLRRARSGPLERDAPYLVLEYFSGRPVHRALPAGGGPAGALEELTRRMLLALAHVHDAGLVHRDLKAGNVLLDRPRRGPGRVKLTDFGLAEPVGSRSEPGRLSGSLPYVAPETMLGCPVDGRADLYGLGMLLFYLGTGRMAAPASDPACIVRWHLSGATPDPRAIRPALSERLSRLILRLTRRDPDQRPRGAREALALLGVKPGRRGPRPREIDRGELARVRLAVDAVRVGARRVLVLPADPRERRGLVAEARRLAQVHGLSHHRLGAPRQRGGDALERLVAAVLSEQGEPGLTRFEHRRLDRIVPLGRVGGLAIHDRDLEGAVARARGASDLAASASRVAAFLLDAADETPTVLQVEPEALADPLAREVVARLRRTTARTPGPRPGHGGLLVLVDGSQARAAAPQPNRLERIS